MHFSKSKKRESVNDMLVQVILQRTASLWTRRTVITLRFRSSYVPKPTWHIADLQLDVNHPPVSEAELQILAKRALVDVKQLENKEQLRQDLGNLLHMIDQVSSASDQEIDHHSMYDLPRGVTSAPVRSDDEPSLDDSVYESYLKPNMKVDGAQEFFEIQSKPGKK